MKRVTLFAAILLILCAVIGCSVSSPYPETMYTQDIDVAGNITITGTVDGVDISSLHNPVIIRKTADQTIFNSDVLQDDNDLKFSVGANEIWSFDIFIRCYLPTGATGAFQYNFSIPIGSSLDIIPWYQVDSTEASPEWDGTAITFFYPTLYDMISRYHLHCLYIGGANTGTIQFRWSPDMAELIDYTIYANSFIIAYKLN